MDLIFCNMKKFFLDFKKFLSSNSSNHDPIHGVIMSIGVFIVLILVIVYMPWFGFITAGIIIFLVMYFISTLFEINEMIKNKKKSKKK